MKTVQTPDGVTSRGGFENNKIIAEALLWLALAIREPHKAHEHLLEVERLAGQLSRWKVKIVDEEGGADA